MHCDATFRNPYAVGSRVAAIEPWARDPRRVELSTALSRHAPQ